MSKNRVTGKVLSAVAIRYLSEEMEKGRYTAQPSGAVSANTETDIFVAEPLANALDGAVGSNKWMASDGTIFEFTFNNFHHDNQASANMSDVGGPWMLPKPDYPAEGWDWTVTYKIDHTSAFCDAPVFPDDLIAADKCDSFSEDLVRRWIGERSSITLSDVLQHASIHAEAKLWCAAHTLFLTSRSKRLLLADLAKSIDPERGPASDLRAQAAELNEAAAVDEAAPAAFRKVAEQIDALRGNDAGAGFAALSAMASENADIAWSNAVYAYVGAPDDADGEANARAIIALVEARL
ncbi:hypothetical protein [Minwuia sp.]|uniref:hypothetical protein n=1 Tax=Minwuia sp. TaxID=2493630 RepID=UPI003A8E312B